MRIKKFMQNNLNGSYPAPVAFNPDTLNYPAQSFDAATNIHMISAADFNHLWDMQMRTRHFDSAIYSNDRSRAYPFIRVESSNSEDFPNYNGMMVIDVDETYSTQDHSAISRCSSDIEDKTLVSAVPLGEVCTIGSDNNSSLLDLRFKPKKQSTVRDWRNQLTKFANLSHLVLFSRSGALDSDGQLKRNIQQIVAALGPRLNDGKRLMILIDDLYTVAAEFPHLLKKKILGSEPTRKSDTCCCALEAIGMEMEQKFFGSSKLHSNIVIGNKWIAEQALNNGISDDDDFDIIIESVAYPRSPLDYSDDLISEFEINRLHLNEPDKLEMIQKAYQSAQGKRKFLLRIRETGVNVDLICSVSKFAAHMATRNSKRVLIFDEKGLHLSQFYGFATFIQCHLNEGRYLNADDHSIIRMVNEFSQIRPFAPTPEIRSIYEILVIGRRNEYEKLPKPPCVPAQIIPGLFLGSVEESTDPSILKMLNIGVIIGLVKADYSSSSANTSSDMIIWHIPGVTDDARVSLSPYLGKCVKFIDEALRAGKNVLVHCQAGVSRSATLIMAYLMYKKRMCVRRAFSHVRSTRIRYIVQPNEQFMFDLLEYELQLFGRRSVSWLDLCEELYLLNAPYTLFGLSS